MPVEQHALPSVRRVNCIVELLGGKRSHLLAPDLPTFVIHDVRLLLSSGLILLLLHDLIGHLVEEADASRLMLESGIHLLLRLMGRVLTLDR